MKSPFPGMDPYIEARGLWGDFHSSLIQEIRSALAEVVPERYLVRTGERDYIVLLDEEGKGHHPFEPDVSVKSVVSKESPQSPEAATALAEGATDPAPVSMRPFISEEFRENFIEIQDTDPEQPLITSIEVLSPSNKRHGSPGWKVYLRKRQGLFLNGTHLVEIDLLRGGQRMPMRDPWPGSPYTILVARGGSVPRYLAWPAHSLRPLPTIPIPLAQPDPDISINLQAMVEAIFARSRYSRSIDYSKPLTPPLPLEEQQWVEQQLRDQKS